jgi:23S rRNA pseudouridine2605 synthase
MVRLQKLLADAGVGSRRGCEPIILEGRVAVNGQVVRQLGTKVDPLHDHVTLDGRRIHARRKLHLALHKPRGYLCTRRDPEHRQTVGELLPVEWGNLYTVGRLDRESEGLIFLTNDGEFSLHLTHPRYGVTKRYHVEIEGRIEPAELAQLERGVQSGPDRLRAKSARLLKATNSRSFVEIELAEGKNREIRRMFEVLNRVVLRLVRVQIGPIKLGELPPGKWRTLTEAEIRSLLAAR